jgi:hypothetical protein
MTGALCRRQQGYAWCQRPPCAEKAEANLCGGLPVYSSVAATGENTGMEEQSVDFMRRLRPSLVTGTFRGECLRIAKPTRRSSPYSNRALGGGGDNELTPAQNALCARY